MNENVYRDHYQGKNRIHHVYGVLKDKGMNSIYFFISDGERLKQKIAKEKKQKYAFFRVDLDTSKKKKKSFVSFAN